MCVFLVVKGKKKIWLKLAGEALNKKIEIEGKVDTEGKIIGKFSFLEL